MDGVQKANSGHPGAPMGMAEIAEVLWNRHLRHNPANPKWADRDRFVLSNGHGSMLLYSLLHLTGYDVDRRPEEFPPVAQQDPGPPRVRLRARRRDHHRPAGPGHHQRRRHGHGREAAGQRVQPPRPRDRRSPHLCLPRRRLPDGRHFARGLRAGRHLGPGQADRLLGRQRHFHRRPCRRLVHRRHAASVSRPTAGR
jgi:hypothetical protein